MLTHVNKFGFVIFFPFLYLDVLLLCPESEICCGRLDGGITDKKWRVEWEKRFPLPKKERKKSHQ